MNPRKYQYGTKIDYSKLYGNDPLINSFLNQGKSFASQYSDPLSSQFASTMAGVKPENNIMSRRDFMESKGYTAGNPFNIFKKGYRKLGKEYKQYQSEYEAKYQSDLDKYNNTFSQAQNNFAPLLGVMSTLMQGFKGEQAYNNKMANEPDLTETPGFMGYQDGGGVNDISQMTQQDPWLGARGQIESSMNQGAVSHAGAVGMFQITPIALKEYNRKYKANYTFDQVRDSAITNAHVSQGLIRDIRTMIDKVDTKLSDFDKNILAEMAYNYGPYRFIDKLKAKGQDVTLDSMLTDNSLPKETRRHGEKFVEHFAKKKVNTDPVMGVAAKAPVTTPTSQVKRFAGDPYEYKKEGDNYFYRKGNGEFKPINEAGKRELQRRKFQYGGTPMPQDSMQLMFAQLPPNPKQEEINRYLFQTKQYVASKNPDSTMLRSGIKRLYDKNGNQIGYQNQYGQFIPVGDNQMAHFEGKPNAFASSGKYQDGGSAKKATAKDAAKGFMRMINAGLRSSILGEETGTIFDKIPMPSNEIGMIGKAANIGKIGNIFRSLFSSGPSKKQVSKELLDEFGERLATGDINWKNIPGTQYHISAYGGKHTGRNVLMVRDKNGIVQPFYQRTGKGTRATDRPEAFNTEGTWVPFYGVGKANMPKGNVISDHWFVKPSGMRSGSEMDQYTSDILNKFIGTGSRGDDFFKKNWPYEFSGNPKIMNEFFRLHGYDIDMVPKNLGYGPNELQMYQGGGPINETGYTPGTQSMNNPYNIIPSNNITMQNTPFPLDAYPIYGDSIGKPAKLKPGLNYYFPGASGVLEVPQAQYGFPNLDMNAIGGAISQYMADPLQLTQRQDLQPVTINNQDPFARAVNDLAAISGLPSTRMAHRSQPGAGFIRVNGDNDWAYKDNGDGSYSTMRLKDGKTFTVNKDSKNQGAYIAIAKLFNNQGAPSAPQQGGSQTQSTQPTPQESRKPKTYGGDWSMDPYNPARLTGRNIRTNYPDNYSTTQASTEDFVRGNFDPYRVEDMFNRYEPSTAYNQIASQDTNYMPQGKMLAPILSNILSSLFKKPSVKKAVIKAIKNDKEFSVESRKSPKGPYYQFGGNVQPNFVPIQTEKGEMLYHLDGSISKVAAKKLHKHMDADEVTDIVPEDTFVGSRDPKMRISKNEAEKIVLGSHAIKYQAGKPTVIPKKVTFADIFRKTYHTPAELMDIIDKKFPVVDKDGDIFVKTANKDNTESRDQYMSIVKYMTEVKKPVEAQHFQYGGVPKFQLGGIGEILGSVLGFFTQMGNNARVRRNQDATLRDIDQYQKDNIGNLGNIAGISGLSNLMGYASQDFTPEMANFQPVLNEISAPYQSAISNIGVRQQQNQNFGRAFANDAYNKLVNIDPRLAYASSSTIGSNAMNNASQQNMQLGEQRDNLRMRLGQQRANILRESLLNRQSTLAGTRSARNQANAGLFGNFAQIGSDYFGGRNNVNNTALASRMGARGQYASYMNNANMMMPGYLSGIANGIANLGFATKQPDPYRLNPSNTANLGSIKNNISGQRSNGYPALPNVTINPYSGTQGIYHNGQYLGE